MTHESTFPRTESLPAGQSAQHDRDGLLIRLCESGWIPDTLMRSGIRLLCRRRLAEERDGGEAAIETRYRSRIEAWQQSPVAIATDKANEQHYEVPPTFFETVLGAHLKYSCALWNAGTDTLDQAEADMLALTCARAGLQDGMRILELGCGWGSLTLWMAEHYPQARIVAVSNSGPQRNWIMARARERDLDNVEVITADINDFAAPGQFDRVVSVEMFEHVRNHKTLFSRVHDWLAPGGALFVHVFCHRRLAYLYESKDDSDWMARHFFSGGMMPSYDLFLQCSGPLQFAERWWHDGTHYQKTSEAWLDKLDAHRDTALAMFREHYSEKDAARAVQRWRMFFLAVAEMFGIDQGREWGVGHYLFTRS